MIYSLRIISYFVHSKFCLCFPHCKAHVALHAWNKKLKQHDCSVCEVKYLLLPQRVLPRQQQKTLGIGQNVPECQGNPKTCLVMHSRLDSAHSWHVLSASDDFINAGSLVSQSPQRSSTCRWSFRTRWFWKSSLICWSRTCVERPVCVNALVNWPMTPSSGRLGCWTIMHVFLFSQSIK